MRNMRWFLAGWLLVGCFGGGDSDGTDGDANAGSTGTQMEGRSGTSGGGDGDGDGDGDNPLITGGDGDGDGDGDLQGADCTDMVCGSDCTPCCPVCDCDSTMQCDGKGNCVSVDALSCGGDGDGDGDGDGLGPECGDVTCNSSERCCNKCDNRCVDMLAKILCPDDEDPDRVCGTGTAGDNCTPMEGCASGYTCCAQGPAYTCIKTGECIPSACNAPDTSIATPDGERPIAELVEGDLVYSIHGGELIAAPILATRVLEVTDHAVVEVALANGRVLQVSGTHPTADGRSFADLEQGGMLGGIEILSISTVPYTHPRTHDILPASDTGTYLAGGALIGSTLFAR